MMTFAFSMVGTKEWDAELAIDLHVQSEERGKALAVRSSHIILQRIDVGICLAGM